jgi:D-ribose pyranose/furanose isomerase RbsD
MRKSGLFLLLSALLLCSCDVFMAKTSSDVKTNWQDQFNTELQLLGHRNWILVVDKAFPMQTAPGIEVINTGESLQDVLKYTLQKIDRSLHVKPIIFTDKELEFITPQMVPYIDNYKKELQKNLKDIVPQTLLHDSVFVKIDKASRLFKVLVLKTEEIIPYSSVFLELDCKYWSPEKEKGLREQMGK